jgi:hypothetical protein
MMILEDLCGSMRARHWKRSFSHHGPLNNRDEILCAAGLRFFDAGFFSERYLDNPIEMRSARYRPDR